MTVDALPTTRRRRLPPKVLPRLTLLVAFVAVMVIGGWLWPLDPEFQSFGSILEPPSWEHPFGTDALGRDVLARIFAGATPSLVVALVVGLLSGAVGITLGAIGGYFGGWLDALIGRIVDYFLTIPPFFFILALVALFGADTTRTAAIVGLTLWPGIARLVRAEFLTLREREFVSAARFLGVPTWAMITTEILPNAVQPALVQSAVNAARGVLIVASLGFLGLTDPEAIDWGSMISGTLRVSVSAWWALLIPGLAVTALVALLNSIGDAFAEGRALIGANE